MSRSAQRVCYSTGMRRRFSAILCLLAVVATACGDDSAPDARELQLPGTSGAADVTTSSPASAATGDPATTSTTLRPPPPTEPPEREAPTIGDLEIPCAPSELVELPELPGISDEAITIGTGNDRGGPNLADAGAGLLEMVEVLADHCNANGGIAGRDVRVVDYDAAGTEAIDRVEEACVEVAALVGHRFFQAVEVDLTAVGCGLPSFAVGAGFGNGSPFALHGHLSALFADPDRGANVVLIGPDTVGGATLRTARRSAIDAAGPLTVLGEFAYPVDGAVNWTQIVSAARATGAGQVHLDGGCGHGVLPFQQTSADAGWEPIVVATAAAYDSACLASPRPDRLLIELPFLPFEDGRAAPATQQHAELLTRGFAPQTGNGILAASAFWQWASSASECLGSDLDCYAEFNAGLTDWTAGGLHRALDPAEPSGACAVVLGIEEGAFVRRLPAEPGTYECEPDFSVVLPAPVLSLGEAAASEPVSTSD